MIEIELRGRIRWADGDAAQRLHFPRIFEYFEDGETEIWRRIGFDPDREPEHYDFPRVHVEAKFKSVLEIYAPFLMIVTIGRVGRTSITYLYRVYADEARETLAVEGSMTVVAVREGRAVDLPPSLRRALLATSSESPPMDQ
jgi:acyl-CoA thioesterase FadM